MKISFQMIVFNTESVLPKNMLRACIENVLPYSHEVLIVEGATKARDGHYFDGDTSSFTTTGQSTDGTMKTIRQIQNDHPDKKIISFQGVPGEFWPGKTAMCNVAAKYTTGDVIWQLDSDEFYHQHDMEKIIDFLEKHPQTDRIDFYANHFVGGFDKVIDETNGMHWGNDLEWRRIFKNVPGQSFWYRHEPPIFLVNGKPPVKILTREETLSMGIKMFHYSYVHEPQFKFKGAFFQNSEYMQSWRRYKETGEMEIFGIKPKIFTGEHPNIIKELICT